ncbi:RDD family protein [Cryptosporangium sp. NPDC048952]|uniref:RDD family protein n=1 Tax=Cryptosporangium sp. NPDC048952 TaxID=3363961 RepID=UPI00371B5C31
MWYSLFMLTDVPSRLIDDLEAAAGAVPAWIVSLWVPLTAVLYSVVSLVLYRGMTLGKWLLGLRVVSVSGGPVGFGRALGREAFFVFSVLVPILGLVNTLWSLWDRPHGQCLHDKAAGTHVVRRVRASV